MTNLTPHPFSPNQPTMSFYPLNFFPPPSPYYQRPAFYPFPAFPPFHPSICLRSQKTHPAPSSLEVDTGLFPSDINVRPPILPLHKLQPTTNDSTNSKSSKQLFPPLSKRHHRQNPLLRPTQHQQQQKQAANPTEAAARPHPPPTHPTALILAINTTPPSLTLQPLLPPPPHPKTSHQKKPSPTLHPDLSSPKTTAYMTPSLLQTFLLYVSLGGEGVIHQTKQDEHGAWVEVIGVGEVWVRAVVAREAEMGKVGGGLLGRRREEGFETRKRRERGRG